MMTNNPGVECYGVPDLHNCPNQATLRAYGGGWYACASCAAKLPQLSWGPLDIIRKDELLVSADWMDLGIEPGDMVGVRGHSFIVLAIDDRVARLRPARKLELAREELRRAWRWALAMVGR